MASAAYSRIADSEEGSEVIDAEADAVAGAAAGQTAYDLSLHENDTADHSQPSGVAVPIIEVVAPATLPEEYEFETSVAGRTFKVKVPPGGVEEGQKFQASFPGDVQSMMAGTVNVPVGHWRDGLLNVFGHGVCHPHFWTGCCCHLRKFLFTQILSSLVRSHIKTFLVEASQLTKTFNSFPLFTWLVAVAAAQVHSRLQLNWLGRPGKRSDAAIAFQILITAIAGYFILYVGMFLLLVYLDPNTYTPEDAPPLPLGSDYLFVLWLRNIIHYTYWITCTIVLTNLRYHVRERYVIPGGEYEDCCCSCLCPCLVSMQLLRHTTEYDVYPATCW